jgi:NADPH2:quinone reductase
MRAVLCKAWGEPEDLVIEDVPAPSPGAGEVRIGVHACGLNFADTLIIAGLYQVKPPFPFSPGLEVAGEILEVGPGVEQLKVGDRVAALCGYGGFAEEVIVPATTIFPIPEVMDYVSAAAFAVAYGTSHLALTHRAKLQPGEVLLVHGAAGGVGLTAVEIGKLLGATVIATASSPAKLELTAQYGADHLINYKEGEFRRRVKEITGGKGADVIYDPVGGDVFDQSLRCINWEGRLVVIGFSSGRIPKAPVNIAMVKNFNIVGVYWGAYAQRKPQVLADSLAILLDWYAAGKLKPHISQTYPLEKASAALNFLSSRKSTGKVVLTIQNG